MAHILQLLPDDDALTISNRILCLMKELPSDLRRPNRLSRLILPPQDSYTTLCRLHKRLDAALVHAIFQLLALESGVRLNSLVSNSHRLSSEQLARVQEIRKVHSLWLDPKTYLMTFLEKAAEKWPYQEDGCQACIISRVAGDLDTLLCFRMALLSKTHKRPEGRRINPPVLLRWIQSWISSFTTRAIEMDDRAFERMISKNDADAQMLKKVRKQIWREKGVRRLPGLDRSPSSISGRSYYSYRTTDLDMASGDSKPLPPSPTPPIEEDGPTDYDAEMSIIDHYAALLSTPHLPYIPDSLDRQIQNIQQQMPNTPEPRTPGAPSPGLYSSEKWNRSGYTASVYSSDQISLPSTSPLASSTSTSGFPDTTNRTDSTPSQRPVSTVSSLSSAPSFWTNATVPQQSYVSLVAQARTGNGRHDAAVLRSTEPAVPSPTPPRQPLYTFPDSTTSLNLQTTQLPAAHPLTSPAGIADRHSISSHRHNRPPNSERLEGRLERLSLSSDKNRVRSTANPTTVRESIYNGNHSHLSRSCTVTSSSSRRGNQSTPALTTSSAKAGVSRTKSHRETRWTDICDAAGWER